MASILLPLLLFSSFLSLINAASVVEDLANLRPPPDFKATITTNCLRNPSLRYCPNKNNSSPIDITEIFRSTIVASHLCNKSRNPNCVESFPKIDLHDRPNAAALYLSFDFFWKYCPLTILTIDLSNNSLKGPFPTDILSCAQVQSLDLSRNELSGDVPVQSFGPLTNLTCLNLSYNHFLESKISDSEFFTRFNSSSFIHSGLLPNRKHYTIKFLVLLVGFPVVVVLFFCCFVSLCSRRPDYLPSFLRNKNSFTPAMLEAATEGFSKENLVAKSKGIDIYKGTLRDGRETRIEIYKEELSRERRQEFGEKCRVLVRLRHKNLVRVLGWCAKKKMRALISEWIEGENVETWLKSSSGPSWKRRMEVVIGVAKGMCYLQEWWPEVVYDLRTISVLFSNDQDPQISRFKVRDRDNSSTNVYNFGLFLLEMVTNLRPDDEQEGAEVGYVQYIRVHYPGNLRRVMDERMKLTEQTLDQAKHVICLGLMCTDQPPKKRPSLGHILSLVTSVYESSLAAVPQNQRRHHGNVT